MPLKTHDLKASENNKTHAFSSFKGRHKRLRLLKTRGAQAGTHMRALCPRHPGGVAFILPSHHKIRDTHQIDRATFTQLQY